LSEAPESKPPVSGATLLAAIVAPVAGIMVTSVAMSFAIELPSEMVRVDAPLWSRLGHVLFFLMVYGLPGVYLLEAAIGIPVAVRHRSRLSLTFVATIAGVAGSLTLALLWHLFFDVSQAAGFLVLLFLGALGGVVAGVILWFADLRRWAV